LIRPRDKGTVPHRSESTALRRLALLAILLAPLPAAAQDAFCAGLQRLVRGAASGFLEVPPSGHVLPGSREERRGMIRDQDGPAHGAYLALMLTAPSAQRPNPAATRFHALQAEITRCLPDAESAPAQRVDRGQRAVWTTPQARVVLRSDEGDGFASDAEVDIAVVSRW
jgi:hypothetical protein